MPSRPTVLDCTQTAPSFIAPAASSITAVTASASKSIVIDDVRVAHRLGEVLGDGRAVVRERPGALDVPVPDGERQAGAEDGVRHPHAHRAGAEQRDPWCVRHERSPFGFGDPLTVRPRRWAESEPR